MAAIEQDMWRVKGGWFNVVQDAANGSGSAPVNAWNSISNQSVALAARAEFKVAGTWEQFSKESSFKGEEFGLLVGGGVIWQNGRAQNFNPTATPAPNTYDVNPIGITADARANFGGFNAIGQFLWQEGYPGVGSSESTFGINLQGGAFLTDDLELFGAWCYADTISTQNFLQIGSNWYFAKNNLKMTISGIIPLNNAAAVDPSLRGFENGVGLAGGPNADNNFTLIAQLQVMF
jgi:hypothetical protein